MLHAIPRATCVFLFAPLLILLAAVPAVAQPRFDAEFLLLDTMFTDSRVFDLFVDSQGRVHIVYTRNVADETALVHGIRQQGGWTTERIVSTGPNYGVQSADALLDDDGRVHVAGWNRTFDRLDYFLRDDGVWSRETIEPDSAYIRQPRIDIDPSTGNVAVFALAPFRGTVQRFTRDGSGWSEGFQQLSTSSTFDFAYGTRPMSFGVYASEFDDIVRLREANGFTIFTLQIAEDDEALVSRPDIAIGPGGRAHVTGVVFDDVALRHRTFYHHAGETSYLLPWDSQFADGSVESRIAVDGSGRVHMIAEQSTATFPENNARDYRMFYLVKDGSFWSTEAELTNRASAVELDLDPFGNPHVLTVHFGGGYEFLTGGLFLDSQVGGEVLTAGSIVDVEWFGPGPVDVELSTDGGSTWSVLSRNAVGGRVAVSLPRVETDQGRMRVVRAEPYAVSSSLGDFTIVRGLEEGWSTTPVVPAAADSRIDLEVDDDGTTHAAWIDPDALALSYGVFAQGAWTTEVVDASNDPVGRPSLDFAPERTPVVAYIEEANELVRVARRVSGSWTLEDVPDSDGAAFDVDVLVAEDGSTHVVFYDGVRQQLVHAEQSIPGASWAVTDVGSGQAGWGRGFDLESDGQTLWIAFRDDSTGSGLFLAQRALGGGAWTAPYYPLGDEETFDPELEIDDHGAIHVLCRRVEAPVDARLVWGRLDVGGWALETLPGTVDAAELPLDFTLDRDGEPVVLFNDAGSVRLARRVERERWTVEDVTGTAGSSGVPGLVVGHDGQPRVLGVDAATGRLVDRFRGLDLLQPRAGDVWPVGAERTVEWVGPGRVEAQLSIDGGSTWQSLGTAERDGALTLQVPQVPTRFARVRVVRQAPAGSIEMQGLFSIESSIALLALDAQRVDDGIALNWQSDPGPADLLGYTVARRRDGGWTTVAQDLTRTDYVDTEGNGGDRYRVLATNGLGESFVLGETTVSSVAVLRVWPRPAVAGPVQVAFDVGRARAQAEVVVHDVRGRRVRTLFGGADAPGITRLTWDTRDDEGRTVANGVYFVSLRGGSEQLTRKVVVVR